MKRSTYTLVLAFLSGHCVAQIPTLMPRHYASIGWYTTFDGFPGKPGQFIIAPTYEYRLPVLKNRFGVGLSANFVKSNSLNQQDLSVTPRLYFHPFSSAKADSYIGTGVGYGERQTISDGVTLREGVAVKYFGGFRIHLGRRGFLAFEMSNYRYSAGLFYTANVGLRF